MNLNKIPFNSKITYTEPRKNVYGVWEVSKIVNGRLWDAYSFKTRKAAKAFIESQITK